MLQRLRKLWPEADLSELGMVLVGVVVVALAVNAVFGVEAPSEPVRVTAIHPLVGSLGGFVLFLGVVGLALWATDKGYLPRP